MKFAIDNVLANGIVVGNIFFTNNDISNEMVVSKDDEISKLKDEFKSEIIESERGFNEKLKEKDLVIEKLKEEIFKLKLDIQNK